MTDKYGVIYCHIYLNLRMGIRYANQKTKINYLSLKVRLSVPFNSQNNQNKIKTGKIRKNRMKVSLKNRSNHSLRMLRMNRENRRTITKIKDKLINKTKNKTILNKATKTID